MARSAFLSILVLGLFICSWAQDVNNEAQPRGCRIFLRGGMVYHLQPIRTVHVFVGGPHSPEEVAAFVSMLLDQQLPGLMSYSREEGADATTSMADELLSEARAQDSEQEQAAEGSEGVRGREGFEVSSREDQDQDQEQRESGEALVSGGGVSGEGGYGRMMPEEQSEGVESQAVQSGWDMPEWPRTVLSAFSAPNIHNTVSSFLSEPSPFQHLRQLALRLQPDRLAEARTRQLALLEQQQQQQQQLRFVGRRFGGWAPVEDNPEPALPEGEGEGEGEAAGEGASPVFGETETDAQTPPVADTAADTVGWVEGEGEGKGQFSSIFEDGLGGAVPAEVVQTLQRLQGMTAALRGVLEGGRVEERGAAMEWEPAARMMEFEEEDEKSTVEQVAECFKDMMLEVERFAFSMGGLPLLLLPCLLVAALIVAQHFQSYEEPETTIFVVANTSDVEQPLLDSDNDSKDGSEHGDEHNNPLAGYQPPKV